MTDFVEGMLEQNSQAYKADRLPPVFPPISGEDLRFAELLVRMLDEGDRPWEVATPYDWEVSAEDPCVSDDALEGAVLSGEIPEEALLYMKDYYYSLDKTRRLIRSPHLFED